MKKLLVFFTVLALIGSGIAWACDCCPSESPVSNELKAITSTACDCCPEVRTNLNQTKSIWRNFSFTTLVSLAQRIGPASLAPVGFWGFSDFQSSFFLSSSPFSTSSTPPLYLLHRILRI